MTLRTQVLFAFHHLVPNDNFHYQTPLKDAKFDLHVFGSEKCQLANLVVNRDWLTVSDSSTGYGMHFPAHSEQLQRHDSVHLSSVYTEYSFCS